MKLRHILGFFFAALFIYTLGCGGGDGTSSGGGSTGSDTFLSNLTVSPDAAFTDTATSITARITVAAEATTVTLEKVSTSDSSTATLVEALDSMYDDGDATTHADDIAGDLVYSALLSVDESSEGFIYVRANVDGEYSTIKTINLMDQMTDAQWTLYTSTAPTAVQDYYDTNGAAATVTHLNAGNIDGVKAGSAGVSEDGTGVWYVTENGILGGIMANEPDSSVTTESSADLDLGGRSVEDYEEFGEFVPSPQLFPSKSSQKYVMMATESIDENAIQSKAALYVGPYLWQVGAWDSYNSAWNLIKNSECPKFETTEIVNTTATSKTVTPESFKNWSNYGLAMITTHGDTWYNGLWSGWDDLWGDDAAQAAQWLNPWASDSSQVVFLTNYTVDDDTAKVYEKDLLMHRLALTASGTYAITPAFITYYNGTFPETIVFAAACRSAYNQTMSNAFINKGAGAYIGASDYVRAGWIQRWFAAMVGPDPTGYVTNSMLPLTTDTKELTNIREAYDDGLIQFGLTETTTAIHGTSAGGNGPYRAADDAPSNLSIFPADSAKNLNVPAIFNGGFEEGSAIGHQSSGDYRVVPALGAVTPQTGTYMGAITTGLGTYGSSLTESALSQNMCIPAGATTITFKYDFISEEPMCYVGSAYDDTFLVELMDPDDLTGDALVTGSTESVNGSTWTYLGGDYFSGGDAYSTPQTCTDEDGYTVRHDGTYHTGWTSGSIDVSAYAGNETAYTLRFRVYDQGDSAWDSAATIDDIQMNISE